MIDTRGMVTVAEAAKRMHRSIEQVRRNLREGKLRGQRIGNQWFVDETCLDDKNAQAVPFEPLISPEQNARIRALRARINAKNRGEPFDVLEMLRQTREEH
jgi:hypothetical protein